jgi:hypothetical protein
VKVWLIDQLKAMVLNYEFEQAKKQISTSALDPT